LSPFVFVTGWGGAGFHSPDPAFTRGRGGYFSRNAHPAPIRGPPTVIPWMGPHLLPPIFNWHPCGVWVRLGLERGQGQGMLKKTASPRSLSGVGQGKCSGARVLRGPFHPVMNYSRLSEPPFGTGAPTSSQSTSSQFRIHNVTTCKLRFSLFIHDKGFCHKGRLTA